MTDTLLAVLMSILSWQLYVVIIGYGIVFSAVQILLFLVMPVVGAFFIQVRLGLLGSLLLRVVPYVSVAILMIFVVFTLHPIILGIEYTAAWDLPWFFLTKQFIPFLTFVGLIVIALFLISLLPVIGEGGLLQTIVSGGICLEVVLEQLHKARPELHIERLTLLPGFWESLTYIALSGITGTAFYFLSAMALSALKFPSSVLRAAIFLPFFVAGFYPVIFYGAWLGTQLTKGG